MFLSLKKTQLTRKSEIAQMTQNLVKSEVKRKIAKMLLKFCLQALRSYRVMTKQDSLTQPT